MRIPVARQSAGRQVRQVVATEFERLGGAVRFYPQQDFGGVLQVDFITGSRKKPLLLLGHLDTVYEAGTLEQMPCHVADGKMYGPGVFDMKGGIVMMLLAIAALQQNDGTLPATRYGSAQSRRRDRQQGLSQDHRAPREEIAEQCWCWSLRPGRRAPARLRAKVSVTIGSREGNLRPCRSRLREGRKRHYRTRAPTHSDLRTDRLQAWHNPESRYHSRRHPHERCPRIRRSRIDIRVTSQKEAARLDVGSVR